LKSCHADEKLSINEDIYFGWFVVWAAFLITTISLGSLYSYGIIFIPLATEFGWDRGLLSSVILVSGFTYALVVPITGWLADRFGFKQMISITATILGLGFILSSQIQYTWQLFLFMGFLRGLGAPVAVALPLPVVAHWFVERRGIAMGIATAGIGLGIGLAPLLVAIFMSSYGWRIAVGCLGILIWIICIPASVVMRRPENERSDLSQKQLIAAQKTGICGEEIGRLSIFDAFHTVPFWQLFWVFALCMFGFGMVITHIVPIAQDARLEAVTAAGLMTAIGMSSTIGRLLSGYLSDRFSSRKILFVGIIVQSVSILLILKVRSLPIFYLFAVCYGLTYGGNMVVIPKLTVQIFGLNSMATIFGAISIADGIGFGLGSLTAGYIFNATGSYDISFLILAIGLVIAAIITLILKDKPYSNVTTC